MEIKLFLNEWEGLGFVLKKRLEEEKINVPYYNSREHLNEFKKYEIKSTPVLVVLDNGVVHAKLGSRDEIMTYLKGNVSH